MPPALTPFTLGAALSSIGVAEVFIGDPTLVPGTVGALESIGATEGDITVTPNYEMNALTAPELTGGVVHQQTTTLGNVQVKVPVILADKELYAKISPTGKASGGFSIPQKVAETGVLIIPRIEVGGGLVYTTAGAQWTRTAGNGVAAAVGAAAAPQFAVWLWRATPTFAELPYRYANGGKIIIEITFTAMFDGTKPEGHKVYTIGDPYEAVDEVTAVAAPIEVLPDV